MRASLLTGSLLLLALLANGCAQRYALTLSNSDVISASNKPRLNERGFYVFKDANGQERQVNASKVRLIEPK